jgi:hypothetical protein
VRCHPEIKEESNNRRQEQDQRMLEETRGCGYSLRMRWGAAMDILREDLSQCRPIDFTRQPEYPQLIGELRSIHAFLSRTTPLRLDPAELEQIYVRMSAASAIARGMHEGVVLHCITRLHDMIAQSIALAVLLNHEAVLQSIIDENLLDGSGGLEAKDSGWQEEGAEGGAGMPRSGGDTSGHTRGTSSGGGGAGKVENEFGKKRGAQDLGSQEEGGGGEAGMAGSRGD